MSEREKSSNDPHMWQSTTSEGGSVTVTYNPDDLLANTVGQIGALPTHVLLWTPEAMLKRPTAKMAEEIFDTAKALPLKGNLDVHIGHSSFLNELKRTFQTDIKGRPNVFLRTVGLPWTLLSSIGSKLTRANYYNPLTHAAYIFHPNTYLGIHEVGHGAMFDKLKRPGLLAGARMGLQALSTLAGVPGIAAAAGTIGVTLGMEMIASQNALNMVDAAKKKPALNVLLPAFGTYVGQAFIQGKNQLIPGIIPKNITEAMLYGGAVIAGHIVARAPGVYDRIRQVFAPMSKLHTAPASA
jgi:hypothetical protein